MATGISVKEDSNIEICDHYLYGGQHQIPLNYQASRATKVLELIYTDICRLMKTTSIGNAKYFMLFIDDYSRITVVYFLENQSDIFNKFQEYKVYVKNFHNSKIKQLRSDNSKEYTLNKFIKYLKDSGIQHE